MPAGSAVSNPHPPLVDLLRECREKAREYYESGHIVGMNADVLVDRIVAPLAKEYESQQAMNRALEAQLSDNAVRKIRMAEIVELTQQVNRLQATLAKAQQ